MKNKFLLLAPTILFTINLFLQPITNHQSLITINEAWVRPAVKGGNSALYFIIQNNGDKLDTLIEAKSNLADIVEVHETYKMSSDRTGMRQVKFIAIPPKSKLEFKPGGLHVMLLDMKKDFRSGDSFIAELRFKRTGIIKIKAVVNDMEVNIR